MGAGNVILTAQWTADPHAVTYALGGGTGTLPTQGNVVTAGTFSVASGSGVTRTGYTFAGWNDGTTTYQPGDTYTMGASNVTLTAQWTADTCTAPPSGMIAWWQAENDPNDIAGGHNGTLVNGTTYDTGKVGQAFSFDGTNKQYVDVGQVNLPSTFTIDAWVNPTSLPGMVITKDNGDNIAGGRSYFLNIEDNGKLFASVFNANGTDLTQYETNNSVVSTGSWQHIVVTYNGSGDPNQKMKFYVNGVNAAAANWGGWDAGGTPLIVPTNARIGFLGDEMTAPFSGRIDEVELFNRVLDASEVAAIYNAGTAGKCKVFRSLTVTSDHGTVTRAPNLPLTQYLDGTAVQLTATPNAGYSFTGWSGGGCSGTGSCDVTMNGDKDITASYAANNETLSFNSNGGSVVGDITQDYGTSVSAPADPTRTGYTFAGWFTDDGTFVNAYTFPHTMGLSMTVYAKWTANSETLSFNSNGGSVVTAITQNFDTTVNAPSNPTRTGYTFGGWFTDDGTFLNAYTFPHTMGLSMTVYAKWTANSETLSFNSNGGSVVTALTQDYGTSVNAPADPTRTGYTFSGWFTDDNTFLNAYIFPHSMGLSTTVYAKWTINEYSLTLSAPNGSIGGNPSPNGIVDPTKYTYGTQVTVTATPNTHYSFINWSGDCSGSGACVVTITANASVTAVFQDTTPPDTSIDSAPPDPSSSTSASFVFSGIDPFASQKPIRADSARKGVSTASISFECSLDSAPFVSCISPKAYTGLADGLHNFQVRAKDPAGNPDASPASYSWTIDTAAPVIAYTPLPNTWSTGPIPLSTTVTDDLAVGTVSVFYAIDGFAFSSSVCTHGSGSTYDCTIPAAVWGTSVAYYVTASDTAGNAASNTSAAVPNLYTVGQATVPAGTYTNVSPVGGSTLGGNVTVDGNLDLSSGTVSTGPNTLTLGCLATVSNAGFSSYVIGSLEKLYCQTGSFTYPLGTVTGLLLRPDGEVSGPSGSLPDYSPFTANVTALTGSPSLTVGVVATGLTGSDPAQSASRYWNVALAGGTLTADISYVYLNQDVVGTEANYKMLKRDLGFTAVYPGGTVDAASNTASAAGVSSFSQWAAGNLAPTSANVSLGGRILTADGRGIQNARVTVSGNSVPLKLTTTTGPFGYYRIDNLEAGETYVVTVEAKRFTFRVPSRVIGLTDSLTDVDFIGNP
jgi:uncharacterized repeat protein (TIGR02543 family)